MSRCLECGRKDCCGAWLEKENERLRANWDRLDQWVKSSKVNYTGEDRFWAGYDDYHGDLVAFIKELKETGE